ncbi:asparagine synthetase B family protein [Thiohalobacter thiocyanaticus]|uniref:asparagine synthase (glutamine-hydrolyzing) n=1 Tax=Thiohalobacter thiocyanaticus TaxID=585455 RepID=A0A426QM62_9GAMM|nr:asparagine synthase-related protein [Thiohalobacter thiocyanaticus]RRQ22839.1 asparagine synthase [Thiohalobacter thiocyanaticus]
MTNLCGWIGFTAGRAQPTEAAEAMLSACPLTPVNRCVREPAFCATAGPSGQVLESRGLLIALAGQPRWQRDTLELRVLAERLADAFLERGPACLEQVHGHFSLAIIDPARATVLLATDRLGVYPLAYQITADGVVFGSSLNSLRRHPDFIADINPQALFDYLYFHMVPSPGTIYRHTSKLLAAQYVLIEADRFDAGFYWRPEYRDRHDPEAMLAAELKTHLHNAVERCLDPDLAPTGAFLSGGLDSSTVTGVYAGLTDSPVQAYSIGFEAEGYDETPFARTSAEHFGAQLNTYYVTPGDVASALPLLARAYDEPFGNASAIGAYYCARFARDQGIRCLLAGDGGDELFAGNARYAKQKVFAVYDALPRLLQRSLIEPLALHLPQGIPPLRKLRSYVEQARLPMPERMESYNFLHRTPLQEIFAADFLEGIDPDDPIRNIREAYQRADSDSMLKSMLQLDWKITLADNDLRKVSHTCQLAGLEVRYPMLDQELMEFSTGIPDRLLMRGLELRSFYKRSLKDFLPDATLEKSKHGFGLPFGIWMSEDKQLRELAYDSLAGFRQRGYLNPAYLDQLTDAHRDGHSAYYGVMIWVIMMLELWLQEHA